MPPEYGDAAMGEAVEDQEEPDDVPDDDLRRVIVDARTQCESQKEKLKFDRMLEDHKKGLYPNCDVATRPQMVCAAVHQCHPWISNADTHSTNGGFITE